MKNINIFCKHKSQTWYKQSQIGTKKKHKNQYEKIFFPYKNKILST